MNQRRDPEFWIYEYRPVAILPTSDGGLAVWAFEADGGEFRMDLRYLDKIWFGTTADFEQVTRDEFIQHLESRRGDRYIRWQHGTPLADHPTLRTLYETIVALEDTARDENRGLTPDEQALIRTLRKRTHDLCETMIRERGGTGMPA